MPEWARHWLGKLGQYLLVFWAAVTLNFVLPRLAPGDPALMRWTGESGPTPEQLESIRAIYGLDQPVLVQYLRFWGDLLHGDLGLSTTYDRPVRDVLLGYLPWSLVLVSLGLVGAVVVGALLGAWSAWRRQHGHSGQDSAVFVTVLAVNSMPGFWIGMLLITLFAAKLGWLPSYASAAMPEPGLGWLLEAARRLVMPVLTMILAVHGSYYLLARASMIGVLGDAFIRLARSKGLPERTIAVRHALRAALLPVATNAATAAGAVVGGAVVIETVFSYPGLGKVIAEAVGMRDYPLLQGAFLLATAGVVIANLAADLLYPLIDPRVRRGAAVVTA